MKIRTERDSCISSGACVLEAPQVFDQDDDGVVVLLRESPAADAEDAARNAMMACPAAVITIDEDA
ncbi:ferredoxin [Phytohabitans sp. ZYX-F-186]|uniref:Ferredoxin n=1 Tax=Phytohabitans maris TaxID=3071409 RepID=A0ABU0ZK86_9ACTN|nr:ferredoxin [Phytohabitans sp. ZYX-F-186]MDQ7907454.1 ferredoxin [Phytohabitans sp. ZYX-F-186]